MAELMQLPLNQVHVQHYMSQRYMADPLELLAHIQI